MFSPAFLHGATLPALGEGVQEGFGAAVGLLLIAYVNSRRAESTSPAVFVNPDYGWLIASLLITLAFFATLGRGFVLS